MGNTSSWFDAREGRDILRDRRWGATSTASKAKCPLCHRAWRTHYPNAGLVVHLIKMHALPLEEAVKHVDAVALREEVQDYGFLLKIPWTVTV